MIEQITEFLSGFRRTIKGYDRCLEAIRHHYGLSQTEVTIISFLHNNPLWSCGCCKRATSPPA